jgi:transposase-like protein
VVARLEGLFESWDQRDLSAERYTILFLDGLNLKVRLARRVVSVPVLAVLGVAEDGTKVLVSLRLAASEATSHWAGILIDPERRGLTAPLLLVVVDGHAGLRKALEAWPGVQVQRCTRHKLVNHVEHCSAHARAEMKGTVVRSSTPPMGSRCRRPTRRSWQSGRGSPPRWLGRSRRPEASS